jgi:hypothetical protein
MVEMVGAAFEASGKMENLPPGADELAFLSHGYYR